MIYFDSFGHYAACWVTLRSNLNLTDVRGQFPWYVIVIVALVIVVVASFACSKVKNNQARRRSQEREGNGNY